MTDKNLFDPALFTGRPTRFLALLFAGLASAAGHAAEVEEAADQAEADQWEAGAENRAHAQHSRDVLDRLNDLGIIYQTARAFNDTEAAAKCQALAAPLVELLLVVWCERTEVDLGFDVDVDDDGDVAEAEEVEPTEEPEPEPEPEPETEVEAAPPTEGKAARKRARRATL